LGAEGFQKLVNQVVEQARAQGLVSDRLHMLDAPDIAGKGDLFRMDNPLTFFGQTGIDFVGIF
jgi:hypothetical protein